MKRICIVGSGHVGLVTGACLSELGNQVICIDDDHQKIECLVKGVIPFFEPGLKEMVHRNMNNGRLSFATDVEEGPKQAEIVFICVGTPQKQNGEADPTYIEEAAKRVAKGINNYKVIVGKSTVPVKTSQWVKRTIMLSNPGSSDFDVVSNPEFLREGKAIHDFMHPDRIVLGVESERAEKLIRELYEPLHAPIIVTNLETAELIKHTSNVFLALKISYINVIANICERVGADVLKVAEGIGYDKRIGREFLDAGVGFGGYCLPKDLAAFIKIAQEVGYDPELLKAIQKVNDAQIGMFVKKIKNAVWNLNGKDIGILGLSYKPNTDDMREAPSIEIVRELQHEGARLKAYDPQAMENARGILKDVLYCASPYEVSEQSDALVIITEWDEFKDLDLPKVKRLLRQPIVIDGRNIFDPSQMKKLGFVYHGVGR